MMAEYCKETFSSIRIEVLTADDLKDAAQIIMPRFDLSSSFVGTRSYHFFQHQGDGKIGAKILSSDTNLEKVAHHVPILSNSTMNDFDIGIYLYDFCV